MRKTKIDLATAVHGAAKSAMDPVSPRPSSPARPRAKSRLGRKGVLIHVPPEIWRELRQLALDEDTSVQALGLEALTHLVDSRRKLAC